MSESLRPEPLPPARPTATSVGNDPASASLRRRIDDLLGPHFHPPFSDFKRAAIIAVVWLPVLTWLAYIIPSFNPIFVKLRAADRLPLLTELVLRISSLVGAIYGVPGVVWLLALIGADIVITRHIGRMRGANPLYRLWLTLVIVTGIAWLVMSVKAVLLPTFRYSR
jgi:hypothetical protein